MEAAKGMTGKQRGAIFAIAGKLGLDNDALHDVVGWYTGQESISQLTSHQAATVIDELKRRAGQGPSPGWATERQRGKLFTLCRELGWVTECGEVDMKRLEGFIRSKYGIERFKWLTSGAASKVIEGLKAMDRRGKPPQPPGGSAS